MSSCVMYSVIRKRNVAHNSSECHIQYSRTQFASRDTSKSHYRLFNILALGVIKATAMTVTGSGDVRRAAAASAAAAAGAAVDHTAHLYTAVM